MGRMISNSTLNSSTRAVSDLGPGISSSDFTSGEYYIKKNHTLIWKKLVMELYPRQGRDRELPSILVTVASLMSTKNVSQSP